MTSIALRTTLAIAVIAVHRTAAEAKAKSLGHEILMMDPLWRQNTSAGDPMCYVVLAHRPKRGPGDHEQYAIWVYNADGDFMGTGEYQPMPDREDDIGEYWKDQEAVFARYFERRRRG